MRQIPIDDFSVRPFQILDKEWAILVAGTTTPNPMTVSWGGFGTLWNRPIVTVFVRPSRHTFQCLEESKAFTLNLVPPAMRGALELCGAISGRNENKWERAKLAPAPSKSIPVPGVAGAKLTFECRTLSWVDLDPARFLDPALEGLYPGHGDYHRVFFGEVLLILGASD